MRLGLIGPADNRDDLLERAVRFLYREVGVHRAVYLGLDAALERVVRDMAARLVGDDPGEEAVWQRAAERCATASPEEIDSFLQTERERMALVVFGSLPGGDTRLIELLNGKVAVLIHDKALLDEDDIASATYLVFGKSDEPLVKPIGSRWFLSPGPLSSFGIMTLEDRDGRVELSLYDNVGREVRRERLIPATGQKVSVSRQ
jgi:hypothetical protein